MNRIIKLTTALAAVLCIVCTASGCKKIEPANPDNDSSHSPAEELVLPEGSGLYGEDGSLLLTSASDRYVYKSQKGYTVFLFKEDKVSKIYEIEEYGSSLMALNALIRLNAEGKGSGGNLISGTSDRYIVYGVTKRNTRLGDYLGCDRAEIADAFGTKGVLR